ncbi:hypothetical protein MXB_4587 [Myxobolus squamalis]|nr:hypothetical protein MXB_4587 [Myxobolus squamalis]
MRVVVGTICVVLTFGITIQNSKYYSCYTVGPNADKNATTNAMFKQSISESLNVGYLLFFGILLVAPLGYAVHLTQASIQPKTHFKNKLKKKIINFQKRIQKKIIEELSNRFVSDIYLDCFDCIRTSDTITDDTMDEIIEKLHHHKSYFQKQICL